MSSSGSSSVLASTLGLNRLFYVVLQEGYGQVLILERAISAFETRATDGIVEVLPRPTVGLSDWFLALEAW
jgi:hypothetical protein